MVLPILVGIALGIALYQMLRRPVLRRLAIRETSRRRGETILVIAGSLLGTAIITGSFIVGDTLDSSIRATATTQLGPVDETVVAPDSDTQEAVLSALRDANISGVDGLMEIESTQVSLATGGSEPLSEPSAQLLEMDFEEARSFGSDPTLTGIDGDTPGEGAIAITEDLAAILEVQKGDDVVASLYGQEVPLEVDRILPRLGLAGFWTGFETTSANAFVQPGTIEKFAASGTDAAQVPPTYTVLVSNEGGVEDGALTSGEVVPRIEDALSDVSSQLRVEPLKKDKLDSAKEQGDQFAEFFLGIGSFAIMAGILLLVQIFVMLSEERKSQLGMLRAVGMRRSDLIRSFYMQGGLYAIPAGVAGTLLGIAVGAAIVKVAAPIFGGFGDFSLELRFDMEAESLITGLCLGILISLATVFLTSFRISRINIIRAIRDLPEPARLETRRRTYVFGGSIAMAGALLFIVGIQSEKGFAGALLGPPIALFGALPFISLALKRRAAVILVALLSLAWGVFGDSITGGKIFGSGDIFGFVLQGLLLNVAAVVLLSQIQENLGAFLHRFAPRSLPLRLGMAYPLARRFRTGLTLGMFSLVIFTMVFISVLSNVFGGQVETTLAREAGGFDVFADSLASDPPSADEISSVDGVSAVSTLMHGTARFTTESVQEPTLWTVTGVDDVFVEQGPPALDDFDPSLSSEKEAWATVLADPTKAIVPTFFLNTGGGGPPVETVPLGGEMTFLNPVSGRSEKRTVVGFTANDFTFSGAYMSNGSVESVMGDLVSESRFYIAVEEGDDADAVAKRIQGDFIAQGVEAQSLRATVEEFQAGNLQFFRLMQGYLALGLLVGIAGIGVTMVRAVRERRREVGVLRSLGFLPSMVRRAFIIESGFTALEGVLVGTVLALITAYQLVGTGEFGEGIEFVVPWRDIVILVAVALIASLLATAWPARQASRIPPAVALRVAD